MDDQEHIDLEDQIYVAEILAEKRPEIHNKIHTAGSLEKLFKLSIKDILGLCKRKIISINYCYLMDEYVHMYKRQKPQVINVGENSFFYHPEGLLDGLKEYCGLKKTIYHKLIKDGKVPVKILDFENTLDDKFSPIKFMNFKIEIDRKKVAAFLEKQSHSGIPDIKDTVPEVRDFEIYYSDKTGIGYVNGKRFKFKNNQPEFFVFAELYNNFGESMERKRVLILSKHEETNSDMETYFINELAKKIRTRTGLNIDGLVLNNGCLTLTGIKLKSLPK